MNIKKTFLTSNDSLFEKSLDLQKYIEELSSQSVNVADKFSFTWAGKSNAIKSVLIPSKLTLDPKPNESIKWDESENLFIEGDNLEVLKLLQKAYFEKVKMIYIDPPYNTGHDFVYNDNFSAPLDNYLKQTGQKTETGESVTTNKETNGRYHSDWLSMMYPRLKLAWNLLREDGVIFVSIDDNEVHHLRMLMDEIFGEENFIESLKWKRKKQPSFLAKHTASVMEYILVYAKDSNKLEKLSIDGTTDSTKKVINLTNQLSERVFGPGVLVKIGNNGMIKKGEYKIKSMVVEYLDDVIYENGISKNPVRVKAQFSVSQEKIDYYIKNKLLFITVNYGLRRNVDEEEIGKRKSITDLLLDWGDNQDSDTEMREIFNESSYFDYTKPTKLIKNIIKSSFSEDEIVLDFFSGSGTTAHAVLKLNQEDGGNRKFICVQLPEKLDNKSEAFQAGYKTISDIAKERIRRVIRGYGENPQPIDSGFKVFTLTESNYPENNFDFNPEKSQEENKEAFIAYLNKEKQSQLFEKENDTSIVYENIVKEGLSLNSKVEFVTLGKNKVYKVTDGDQQLLICLESKLESETVKELTDKSNKDKLFICLESALDDTTAANLSLNLELKTI